jgi:hypothetical protein
MKVVKNKIKLTNLEKVRYFEGGWEACKEKVLKIVYSNSILPMVIPQPEFYPLENIIKQIKKL